MRRARPAIQLSDISVEKKHAIVAYCDITDFTSWTRRSANTPENQTTFLARLKYEFLLFRLDTGYFTIRIGDGIIVIVETVKANQSKLLVALLRSILTLERSIAGIFRHMPWPRLEAVRFRITAGPVLVSYEPSIEDPARFERDVIGEPMNLGDRLLDVARDVPFIIHGSAVDLLTPADRKIITLDQIEPTGHRPRNVDPEDMRDLFKFGMRP